MLKKILILILCAFAMINSAMVYTQAMEVKAAENQESEDEMDDNSITKSDVTTSQQINGTNIQLVCKYSDNSCASSKPSAQDIIADIEEKGRNMELVTYLLIGIVVLRVVVSLLRIRGEMNGKR